MAYSDRLVRYSFRAGATLTQFVGVPGWVGSVDPNIGTQYLVAKYGAEKDVAELHDVPADPILGVTTTKSQHLDMPVAIAVSGSVPVQAASAIAYGDKVGVAADGRAEVWTVGAVLGTCVEAASGAGVLATVNLELGK
jgi:hypothetical protein